MPSIAMSRPCDIRPSRALCVCAESSFSYPSPQPVHPFFKCVNPGTSAGRIRFVSIALNLARIRARIARAAVRAGRKPEEITLVAVSKNFPAEAIREAYAAGIRDFGENRVQDWESKQPHLTDLDATWHLVGHLQSNKTARAARLFQKIDSVDSLELAKRLDRAVSERSAGPSPGAGAQHAAPLQVLIEVRLDPIATKSGVSEADLPALAEAVLALPHLDLRGLMGIPPFFDDPEQAGPYFRRLRSLCDLLSPRIGRTLPVLSMGMSHDFEAAIEEGATEIRLGTALFGSRFAG